MTAFTQTIHKTKPLNRHGEYKAENFLLLLYLFLEFGRPQELVPVLSMLHLPTITIVLLGCALLISKRRLFYEKDTKLFLGILLLMFCHIFLAVNNFWAYHTARSMLMNFVCFLAIVTFITTIAKMLKFLNVWLAIHVYLAVIGLSNGGRGIGGFIGDENDFCLLLNMAIPFALFLGISEKRPIYKIAYWGCVVVLLVANVSTLSRGGFVGLAAFFMYCFFRIKEKFIFIFSIVLMIFSAILFAPEKYWDEIASLQAGSEDSTAEDRMYIWGIGWDMYKANPVIGVGQGNFAFRFSEYELASSGTEGLHGRSRAGRAAHSVYFTLLPELGTVGFVLFVTLIYMLFSNTKLARQMESRASPNESLKISPNLIRNISWAVDGSAVAFLVTGVFISTLYYPCIWVLLGIATVLKKITINTYETHTPSH